QVEGLQGKGLIWRKVAFHFPPLFVRSVLGSGAWRFQRDLGGMKSPILGPGFGIGQETDCTGVCRPLERVRTRVLGSTPAAKSLIWRKVAFHFPPLFVRSVLGSGAWRFQRDLGGMKSPILGPGFGIGQET
ncbi:unnamed protein product, partial [Staurois parvus]